MKSKKETNQSIQITYNVLLKGSKNSKDLLYLFSLYTASNPDFKYNSTYLTDSIDAFFEDYAKFRAKQLVFKKIIRYVKTKTKNEYDIEIIFDSTFRFEILSSTEIETVSKNDIYKFDHMGDKSFIVKFLLKTPRCVEYEFEIEKYNNNDEWKTKIDSFLNIIFKNEKLKQVVF